MGLFSLHSQFAHAQFDEQDGFDVFIEDPADGNDIPEPVLADYKIGERTPGFSAITDVVSAD